MPLVITNATPVAALDEHGRRIAVGIGRAALDDRLRYFDHGPEGAALAEGEYQRNLDAGGYREMRRASARRALGFREPWRRAEPVVARPGAAVLTPSGGIEYV